MEFEISFVFILKMNVSIKVYDQKPFILAGDSLDGILLVDQKSDFIIEEISVRFRIKENLLILSENTTYSKPVLNSFKVTVNRQSMFKKEKILFENSDILFSNMNNGDKYQKYPNGMTEFNFHVKIPCTEELAKLYTCKFKGFHVSSFETKCVMDVFVKSEGFLRTIEILFILIFSP